MRRNIARPFWRYYGGKFRAAAKYPAPEFKTIVEPFCGAAGYSCLYPHHDVLLIDASEKVCAVWEFLIGASACEILRLPDLTRGQSVDELLIPQEAKWFLGFWCNNGAATPRKSPTIWAYQATSRHKGWNHPETKQAIARQVEQIKHWRVLHGTYAEAPNIEATWFIDPPYQGAAGSHYPKGSNAIDYLRLGAWCKARTGQAIVCEGPEANWLPFAPFAKIKSTSSKNRAGHSREFIWTNQLNRQMTIERFLLNNVSATRIEET